MMSHLCYITNLHLELELRRFRTPLIVNSHVLPVAQATITARGPLPREVGHTECIYVFCMNLRAKQQLFTYIASTDWFYKRDRVMFTARYERNIEIVGFEIFNSG
jgi:hypothetical protein